MRNGNCEDVRRDMVMWLAGEGDGASVTSHLETCPECVAYLKQLKTLMGDIDSRREEIDLVMEEMDWDGMARRVTRYAMRPQPVPAKARRSWRLPLAAALFGLGLVTGYLVFHDRNVAPAAGPGDIQLANSIRLVETAMDRREIVDFLGRGRLLLTELMHATDSDADRRVLAEAATRLLRDFRYLGQNPANDGIPEARGVMERFSWVLTELSYDPPPDRERVDTVRRLVEKERLLLKVRLIERELEGSAREV